MPTLPLVSLRDVDVKLWGATLLSGISFELWPGESWALLGGNGAGKSTFLRLLRGDVWPHPGSRGRRLYALAGAPEESPIGSKERIALVSAEAQDAYVRNDWNLRVEDVVRTGFAGSVWLDAPLGEEEERRAEEALARLEIASLRGKRMLELSSGEARKVLLARALAPGPRVLLLDEFCNGLDAPSRRSLLEQVSAIARAGTPIVFATHRQEEIVPEVTRGAILESGRLAAQGPRDEILRRYAGRDGPSPPEPLPAPPVSRPSPPARERARAKSENGEDRDRVLISLRDVDVLLDGARVLSDLNWEMHAGENWAVRGPNGAGKSTFLRLLTGEHQAAPGGTVRRLDLGERPCVWDVKARIGLVAPQLQADHRYDVSGREVLWSGFTSSIGLAEEPSAAEQEAAAAWAARLGLAPLLPRRIHSLSYGELRRLLVARALVRDPEVLLLDEPFNGLDPSGRRELAALLEALCQAGTGIVLVTHHDEEIVPAVTHLLELNGGRIAGQGPRRR